jgi:CRP/FNR family transcriptional regulator
LALVVETGLVRLFIQSEDGRQASIAYLHPGDIYAAGEIIPPGPASIQALKDSVLLMIEPSNLFRLAAENLAIAEASIRVLGGVVRHLERVITVRSLGSMTERLAFDMLERASGTQLQEGELVCHVTQEQLADSIGSAREVVSRIMGNLRRSGIVEISRGRVRVLDATRLSRIVGGI